MKPSNVAASVRQRLLNLARQQNWEFNRVLTRYGVERVLCRLSASPHADRFLLKGAMLFTVWEGSPQRATRDLDLLGLRRRTLEELVGLFRDVITTPVEPDGLVFGEVTAEPIRAAMEAGGIRVILRAQLAGARITVQVDVGFGDATVPPPVMVEFPTLLDTPKPKLRAYPLESVIAEKLEAMVRLGLGNSRMKDFFDIWHLAQTCTFNGEVLAGAIRATFATRNTPLPDGPVTALTVEFSEDSGKRIQWNAFIQQAANGQKDRGVYRTVSYNFPVKVRSPWKMGTKARLALTGRPEPGCGVRGGTPVRVLSGRNHENQHFPTSYSVIRAVATGWRKKLHSSVHSPDWRDILPLGGWANKKPGYVPELIPISATGVSLNSGIAR